MRLLGLVSPMSSQRVISADSAKFAARIFNIGTVASILIPFLLMLWIGVSMFVYASVAHHPNPRTVYYNRWAGYRFYGAVGALVVIGPALYELGKHIFVRGDLSHWGNVMSVALIWGILVLAVVPWTLWDIWRAGQEEWQDVVLQEPEHE